MNGGTARPELTGGHRSSPAVTGAHRRSPELTGGHRRSQAVTGAHWAVLTDLSGRALGFPRVHGSCRARPLISFGLYLASL